MKTILQIAAILWCLAYMAFAGTVTLGWDAQPQSHFHLWLGTALLATSTDNQEQIIVPEFGTFTVTVTSFIPGGFGESPPASITLVPVHIQQSNDLRAWTDWTTLYIEFIPNRFFRLSPKPNP
jgi:hypothetical protein